MKVLVLLLVLMLVVLPVGATTIDLADMTIDELLALRVELNKTLALKLGDGWVEISSGSYVVGKDLASERYEFMTITTNEGFDEMLLNIMMADEGSKFIDGFYVSPFETVSFYLDEGTKLDVHRGVGYMRIAPKLPFAP